MTWLGRICTTEVLAWSWSWLCCEVNSLLNNALFSSPLSARPQLCTRALLTAVKLCNGALLRVPNNRAVLGQGQRGLSVSPVKQRYSEHNSTQVVLAKRTLDITPGRQSMMICGSSLASPITSFKPHSCKNGRF